MPKGNTKNEYIQKDGARKATYNKRKKGLFTKLDQITTLCAVDACSIINGPYQPGIDVWPNHEGVLRVLEKFMSMSVMERTKHMENKNRYLENRIKKADAQIKKQIILNRSLEMDNLMSDCLSGKVSVADHLNSRDKQDISSLADKNLFEIDERLELLIKNGTPADAPPPPPPQPPMDVECYVPVMENQGAPNESETSWYPTDWWQDNIWDDLIRGDGASSSKTT
nr:pheres1 [Tanacetum cinerariifolium]